MGSDELPEVRRTRILEMVRHRQRVTVEELSAELDVSRETVRRDLARLDRLNLVRRVHGGAINLQTAIETTFAQRQHEQREAKERIARLAATLFEPGDSLFVDAGSTTAIFAEALALREGLTVVTNSILVAQAIWRGGQANTVHLLGGSFNGDIEETTGELTLAQIAGFKTDYAVLTIGAANAAHGIMDYNVQEASLASAMIGNARSTTILGDRTKFGRSALIRVCGWEKVARCVCDAAPEDRLARAILDAGTEILVAE